MRALSTTHLFHYFFSEDAAARQAIVAEGLRPLSDFPDSDRWRVLERQMPEFYPSLYEHFARPVHGHPHTNSGVFLTPIDFRVVTDTFLSGKPRFRIPVDRIDPSEAVITYVADDERVSLPFAKETLAATAAMWPAESVRRWFALDPTKVFFFVPQVATYQGRVAVTDEDFEVA